MKPAEHVTRDSDEAQALQAIWPPGERSLWIVQTVESTRGEKGLHRADMLLKVEVPSGKLHMVAEARLDRSLVSPTSNEEVHLWRSPRGMQAMLQPAVVEEVLHAMALHQSNWSFATAARAVLLPGRRLSNHAGSFLEEMRECWDAEPICTSVVISFWQRYICQVADRASRGIVSVQTEVESASRAASGSPVCAAGNLDVEELIMKWMPLKADGVLPRELLRILGNCGWSPATATCRRVAL